MATHTAASVAYNDVLNAYNLCVDGDILVIPAGTASWTAEFGVTKGITIQGSTTVTGDHTVAPASWVVNDQTIILDDIVLSGGHGPMIRVTLSKNQVFRATGLTFRVGARTTKSAEPGAITLDGLCPEDSTGRGTGSIRVDHCHFDSLRQIGQWWMGWTYGVTDHCKWTCATYAQSTQGLSMNNGRDMGPNLGTGEIGSWTQPTEFGSDKFVFVEDCLFYNLGTSQTAGKIDGQYGGRFVLRYSQYYNTSVIGGHGTESGGYHRGIRAAEYYNISRTGITSQGWGEQRSGVRLIHHNTWSGTSTGGMPINVHRMFWTFKMGGSTGNGPFDKNATASDGSWTDGAAAYLFASGTASIDSVPSGTTAVLTASGSPGWATNTFAGKVLQNTDQPISATSGPTPLLIISNTANTITFSTDDGGYCTPPLVCPHASKRFVTGEHFSVYQCLAVVDQVGRGQCTDHIVIVGGDTPTNLQYGDQRWPHQALEPVYMFENYTNGSLQDGVSTFPVVVENREYYNQNTNFASNHTTGIGVGLLSARPSSGLVAGVGYWATDTSTLYIATSATTWSTYYTPYIYPHPLTGGATGKIISLSGSLNFGNVIIGQTPTAALSITNAGDTLLTVTNITLPSGFTLTGTTSFTVAAGATVNRTVTFTPLLEQLYSGNITVTSDATSGSGTIACSGTGVVESGGGGGGHGKGHKKGVLVARGR